MRKLARNVLLFLAIVAALQGVMGRKIPKEIRRLDRALSSPMDIVYFCDSTNFAYSMDDADKRPISGVLQDRLPDREVFTLDHGAFNMRMYLAFSKYIVREGRKPDLLIVPINMRSFSAGWDLRPNWQFEQERFLLRHPHLRSFFKPLAVFKAVSTNEISVETYNRTAVHCANESVGTVAQFDFTEAECDAPVDERIRKTLIFQYMYPLKPDHRLLQAMLEIVDVLSPIGVRPIFYITPLDMDTGEKYLPGSFRKTVTANVDVVKSLLRDKDATLLDLTQSLPAGDFSWTLYPNEHLNQRGKSFVVERLVEAIQARDQRS